MIENHIDKYFGDFFIDMDSMSDADEDYDDNINIDDEEVSSDDDSINLLHSD